MERKEVLLIKEQEKKKRPETGRFASDQRKGQKHASEARGKRGPFEPIGEKDVPSREGLKGWPPRSKNKLNQGKKGGGNFLRGHVKGTILRQSGDRRIGPEKERTRHKKEGMKKGGVEEEKRAYPNGHPLLSAFVAKGEKSKKGDPGSPKRPSKKKRGKGPIHGHRGLEIQSRREQPDQRGSNLPQRERGPW